MESFKIFDAYSLRARLFPVLFASAPVLVCIGVLVPLEQLSWTHAVSGMAIPVVLYIAADMARRAGKKNESNLYKKWDGAPTTRMLRHRDGTLDASTKAEYLIFLARKIDRPPPTAQDEANDPVKADVYYARCGAWLRENTRSTKKFAILFAENITYGYRRNLLALKMLSLAADTLILIGIGSAFVAWSPPFASDLSYKLVFLATFCVFHGALLSIAVSEKDLKEASETYARQLLLSCEVLRSMPTKQAAA